MTTHTGVVYVHSAPTALRQHIEWAISAVSGVPCTLRWTAQPALPGTWRCEWQWSHGTDISAPLASALRACKQIRFEVTCDAIEGTGRRYAFTPRLGLFQSATSPSGDLVVTEQRIRAAMTQASGGSLREELDAILGGPWDDELEVFRYAAENDPVRCIVG